MTEIVRKLVGDRWVTKAEADGVEAAGSTVRLVRSALITNDDLSDLSDAADYPIAFSVANGDFAVGDSIIDVWTEVLEFFDGPDNAELHLRAQNGPDALWTGDLYATAPDLAYNTVINNKNAPNGAALSIADGNTSHGLLDVRTNNAAAPAQCRVLPSTVLTADLEIRVILVNGTTWTQGQLYVYALVASPA